MAVWTKEELEREQVRGLFAIAVLASITVYLVSGGIKPVGTNASGLALASFINGSSIILLMFWTLYVLTAAISMTFWSSKKNIVSTVLGWFKDASQWCFYLGSFTTLGFAIYFIPQILYFQVQTEGSFERYFSYGVFILAFVVFVGVRVYRRLRKPTKLVGAEVQ